MLSFADQNKHWVALAFPAMVAGRVLGAAISPLLFAHLPVLLIAMSPFLIHLVAVAPLLSEAVYFPVAIVVTTVQAMIGYHFGRTLGSEALAWIMERVPLPPVWVERLLKWVRRLSVPAVCAVPGPVMGTVAGVAKVPRRIFFVLVAPAQIAWVSAAYFVGEALLEYIAVGRGFVIAHAPGLTVLTVLLVSLHLLYGRFVKGKLRARIEGLKKFVG